MYNVFYDTPTGTKCYCLFRMTYEEALIQLSKWKAIYGENGGNPYPNGKGHYPFFNPRIMKV